MTHPRATGWAVALLVLVFLAFGIWVEAAAPDTMLLQDGPAAQAAWETHFKALLG